MRKLLVVPCVLLGAALAAAATASETSDALAKQALTLAEQGRLDPATAQRVAGDPLTPWIDYATLHRNLDSVDAGSVRAFLDRNPGQVAASLLRDEWLGLLAQRHDWKTFRAFRSDDEGPKLRCADLAAQLDGGPPDARWIDAAMTLWNGGQAQPVDCDGVFAWLATQGKLGAAQRWQRIDAAAADVNMAVMRSAASGLPSEQAAQALAYARFIDAPSDAAASWPRNDRSRRMISIGLAKLARRDPGSAQARLERLQPTMGLNEADRGRVQYAIALWTVASYSPGSAQRLAAVPASAYDPKLHEWQVREALARGDDATALKAVVAMDPAQRNDPRWQYFEARLRERNGDAKGADALYRQAARTASYGGFLAADRLKQPYAICPLEVAASASERARIAASPALVRAFELYRIERPGWAEKEWKQALAGFDDHQRQVAVLLANQMGWYDRATFGLGKSADGQPAPDELRLYTLRFPLDYADTVREQARRNGIDPAWVAAEIRAESAWNPRARSGADARGLMQLLVGVGQHMARTLGVAWSGGDTLYQARPNIAMGSAYLRQMLDRFGGRTYLAIGAYNAGAGKVAAWMGQRGSLDPDLWIETVPYQETREYIMRVLAFSVIYDWRFGGKATPLSERLLGRIVPDSGKRGFACPPPVPTQSTPVRNVAPTASSTAASKAASTPADTTP